MSSSADWAIYSETLSKTYRRLAPTVAIPTQTRHPALDRRVDSGDIRTKLHIQNIVVLARTLVIHDQ